MKSHYQTLGLADCSSLPEVRRAYRACALKHHPDRGGDQEKMKEINEAYDYLLKNKDAYDCQLSGKNLNGFTIVVGGMRFGCETVMGTAGAEIHMGDAVVWK